MNSSMGWNVGPSKSSNVYYAKFSVKNSNEKLVRCRILATMLGLSCCFGTLIAILESGCNKNLVLMRILGLEQNHLHYNKYDNWILWVLPRRPKMWFTYSDTVVSRALKAGLKCGPLQKLQCIICKNFYHKIQCKSH